MLRATFLVQGHGRLESNELVHVGHVDAVIVGVANLWRTAHNHNALGVQTIENANDALAQRGAAHNTVVDHHQIVHPGADATVSDVVDVRRQIVARIAFRDECAHLDVFPRHFFGTNTARQDLSDLGLCGAFLPVRRFCEQSGDLARLLLIEIFFKSLNHTIVSRFSCIGDIREHRVFHLIIDGFEDVRHKTAPHLLAFLVNVTIRSTTEVHALKRAGRQRLRLEDLFHTQLTVSACDEGLPGLELHNFVHFEIEGGLQHRALAGQGKNLVVLVPKRRTNAPRIAQHEGFAATRDAAHHITAVPHGGRLAEHVGHVDMLLNIVRNVAIRQPHRLSCREAAFRLAV